MSEGPQWVTRRRLLATVGTVGAAGAATGAGTMAYFADAESSSGAGVHAGTLDLTLDGADQDVTVLDVTGAVPGDPNDGQGQNTVQLGNAGSLPGTPEVEIDAIQSSENGYYGQENGQDGSPNDGELDEHLEVRATVGTAVVWPRQTVASLSVASPYAVGTTIAAGGAETFTLEWWLPGDTSNLAQSDGVVIDLTVRLVQTGGS